MKKSVFIQNIRLNDTRYPGRIIDLDVHEIDGGFLGISSDYVEEEANYIANPYQECQLVKLTDPMGNDEALDPPLEEDELVGFLKILVAVDSTAALMPSEQKEIMLDLIAKKAGLTRDRLDVLLGMAKETLDMAALAEFKRVLKEDTVE